MNTFLQIIFVTSKKTPILDLYQYEPAFTNKYVAMLYSISFSFPETYAGLAEADGIARFDGRHLTLEFQVRDAVFGVVKSGVKEIVLPVEEIAMVHYKRGTFSSRLSVRSHKIIEDIPVQKGGEFILSIKRKHRDEGEEFASILQLGVSEAKLRRLEGE